MEPVSPGGHFQSQSGAPGQQRESKYRIAVMADRVGGGVSAGGVGGVRGDVSLRVASAPAWQVELTCSGFFPPPLCTTSGLV